MDRDINASVIKGKIYRINDVKTKKHKYGSNYRKLVPGW